MLYLHGGMSYRLFTVAIAKNQQKQLFSFDKNLLNSIWQSERLYKLLK